MLFPQHVSLEEGIISLSRLRSKWMDTPERLMRVARHYERAVHILIRKTVRRVQTHLLATEALRKPKPAIGNYNQFILLLSKALNLHIPYSIAKAKHYVTAVPVHFAVHNNNKKYAWFSRFFFFLH